MLISSSQDVVAAGDFRDDCSQSSHFLNHPVHSRTLQSVYSSSLEIFRPRRFEAGYWSKMEKTYDCG